MEGRPLEQNRADLCLGPARGEVRIVGCDRVWANAQQHPPSVGCPRWGSDLATRPRARPEDLSAIRVNRSGRQRGESVGRSLIVGPCCTLDPSRSIPAAAARTGSHVGRPHHDYDSQH